ncbi:tellurite resistance TerB family protein, partial [Methylobacterium sp. sgz302003]|uniref:tellurite resistance TerB family protein n=1 Tax=Methylobacterium oryzisoli TaxID=3385502 RepID=UPI00397B3DD6
PPPPPPPRGGYGHPQGGHGHPQGGYGHAPGGSPLDQIARSVGGSGSKAAMLGGLASLVLGARKGHRAGHGAFGHAGRIGGLAMVASLAYQAYQQWQASQPARATGTPAGAAPFGAASVGAAPMGSGPGRSGGFLPSADEAAAMLRGTRFQPASPADEQAVSLALLTAMVAAAKADGHIDAAEQTRIFGEMDRHALDADDKAFLMDALRARLDVETVARLARTPEEAAEIYAASLMAIDVDTPQERAYLDHLARRLGLDPGLVQHLDATVGRAVRER